MHSATLGFFFDPVPGLSLRADEEDVFAAGDGGLHQTLGADETFHGLFHIDDVNHVSLAVDIRLHFRIPAADAVTEMHAGIHQRFDEFCLRRCHD